MHLNVSNTENAVNINEDGIVDTISVFFLVMTMALGTPGHIL